MVPVSVSTGGHKVTHIVTEGSLRKVIEFRTVGRWVATHKLRHADSFFGVCNEQALYDLLAFRRNPKHGLGLRF
jgi:hypothetical protein